MKVLSIVVMGLLVLSSSAQASHELVNQPAVVDAKAHYDMHDLKHWLLGYPQVNLSVTDDGIATVTGHVESSLDANTIVKQIEKTAGIRKVANLINVD